MERLIERFILQSRWLLVPFYLGLVFTMLLLVVKFGQHLLYLLPQIFTISYTKLLVGVLTLVDLLLVANLLMIVIISGYESFVSKLDTEDPEEKPSWMGQVGFSGLKLKVISSIVTISGIELLKVFISAHQLSNQELGWKLGIHLTFVVSALIYALTDRYAKKV
ncbi:TIGR00645 family protein [Gallaecimonas sp. GXIMD4217]|uniref:TIGR00645 family protein n=1 Tax=Gallaecimonas sp. GXIMD4217 TaxID=3131927 RepID=UPI00311B432F